MKQGGKTMGAHGQYKQRTSHVLKHKTHGNI